MPIIAIVFQIATFVMMTTAAFLVWTVRSAFKGGQIASTVQRDIEELRGKCEDLNKRMDRAGHEMSNLASEVQGLPDRMRRECISMELATQMFAESARDRDRIWQEIAKLEGRRGRGQG